MPAERTGIEDFLADALGLNIKKALEEDKPAETIKEMCDQACKVSEKEGVTKGIVLLLTEAKDSNVMHGFPCNLNTSELVGLLENAKFDILTDSRR
jgi:hypothetical protein